MLTDERIVTLWESFDPPSWAKWQKAYLDFITWARDASSEELRTPGAQKKLWSARAITGAGYGDAVNVEALLTDAEVVDAIVELRTRAWPAKTDQRATDIQGEFERILSMAVARGTKARPSARLHRLFGALLPGDLTCVLNYNANRRVADLLLGDPRGPGLSGQVKMRARLRAVLGHERDLAQHVRRSTFCWWLHDNHDWIVSDEPTSIPLFQVAESRFKTPNPTRPCVILESDTWDDDGWVTQFRAYYAYTERDHVSLGAVKILRRGSLHPQLQPTFSLLDADSCSLGTSLDYYERLARLGPDVSREILRALRDVAYDPQIAERFRDDPGFQRSLLRFSDAEMAFQEARSRFFEEAPRIPPELPPDLTFSCQLPGFDAVHRLHVAFSKAPQQLGRMMALVGKNGTGKTRLLAALAHALSGLDAEQGTIDPGGQRRRVVTISFSAFDRFARPRDVDGSYSYHGLRRPGGEVAPDDAAPRVKRRADVVDLEHAYLRLDQSLREIRRRGRAEEQRWLDLVESTAFFRDHPHVRDPFGEGIEEFLEDLRDAGSGHQMLVFVATAIIESVRAGTVVLFDEPETHFHPNVLSTLLRLLYDALDQADAYAILATHSPIVVQEIPRRYLRIVRLEGRRPIIDSYDRESFGENLSEIVQYAFDVNEGDKSYVTILRKLAKKMPREQVEALFDGELGLGARMVLREAYRQRDEPE